MPLGLRLRLAVPLFVLSVLGILDFYDWAIPRPQQTRANVDDTCVQPDHALRLQLGLADSVDALMLDTCAPLQPGTYEARLSYLGSSPVQFAVSHELVRGAPGLGLHRRRLLDVEQRRVHVLGAHAVDARFTVAVELNGVWDERLWEMDENDVIEFMFGKSGLWTG